MRWNLLLCRSWDHKQSLYGFSLVHLPCSVCLFFPHGGSQVNSTLLYINVKRGFQVAGWKEKVIFS